MGIQHTLSMRDSKWQHNVTKGTPPSTKKKTTSLILFAQHWGCEILIFGHLWARQQLDWQQSLLKSLLLWLRASQAHPASMWVPATMPFRWIIYYIWIHCCKCSAFNETKANGPGNSSCMPSNNEGTLQVTIIGASVHKCQDLHTSRLFFGAAEPPLEMDRVYAVELYKSI